MAKTTLREQLDQERADRKETRKDIGDVLDVALRHHEDAHEGVFRHCENPVCKVVSVLEYESDVRPFL